MSRPAALDPSNPFLALPFSAPRIQLARAIACAHNPDEVWAIGRYCRRANGSNPTAYLDGPAFRAWHQLLTTTDGREVSNGADPDFGGPDGFRALQDAAHAYLDWERA